MIYVRTKTPGFVLVLTLLILSALIVMVTAIYNRVVVYAHYSRTIKKREQAKTLALSGIQCAIQSLENILNKKEEENKAGKKSSIIRALDLLDTWHTLNLDTVNIPPDTSLEWYVSSEIGKINLYELFDAKNKKYKIDQKSKIDLGKMLGELGELGKKLEKELPQFFLGRSYEPQELTEFLTLPALDTLKNKLFLQKKGKPPFFMDLFSLHEGPHTLNPFCLSVSVKNLLGFQTNAESKKKLIAALEKLSFGGSLEVEWDKKFAEIYGKSWKEIPETLRKLFVIDPEPFLFSVTSCARVGAVTQKVYALVKQESNKKTNKAVKRFVTQHIYWI